MAAKPRTFSYILFLDVVSYSSRSHENQIKIFTTLNLAAEELRRETSPDATAEILRIIPTGDGMAIVFFESDRDDPWRQPLVWASGVKLRIEGHNQKASKELQIALRIGLHSQHVTGVQDVNQHDNVVGPGINNAQRVMDAASPGAVLASATYAEMIGDSGEYRHLVSGPYDVHIKGRRTIPVFNVHGTVDGVELGICNPPRDKPRADMLPYDLAEGVLKATQCLAKESRGIRAFTLSMLLANRNRLEHALRSQEITDAGDKWRQVDLKLTEFARGAGNHTYLELSSLITPDAWKTPEWRRYQQLIFNITRNTQSLARRMHFIEDDQIEECGDELVSLMLAELACGIRGRVWLTPKNRVTRISDDAGYKDGYRVTPHVCLFDCGTYYGSRGRYEVILSDIEPYFMVDKDEAKRQSQAFGIVTFNQGFGVQYAYEELRANFLRGWHDRLSNFPLANIVSRLDNVNERFSAIARTALDYLPKPLLKKVGAEDFVKALEMCHDPEATEQQERELEDSLIEFFRERRDSATNR